MSGGMDSSSVAAVPGSWCHSRSEPLELHAFTMVFDSLIPDAERLYAGLTARALDIPVHFLSADGYQLYEGWDRSELHTPEPRNDFDVLPSHDLWRLAAVHSRVALTGYGARTLRCSGRQPTPSLC